MKRKILKNIFLMPVGSAVQKDRIEESEDKKNIGRDCLKCKETANARMRLSITPGESV